MKWFYIIVITIIVLYYSDTYKLLPQSLHKYFNAIGVFMPDITPVNNDIEGIYRSENKHHGFYKHFMITRDPSDDTKLISIKYRGTKNITDDPDKLFEKEVLDMKKNALDVNYEHKIPVTKKENKYIIYDNEVTKDETVLIFEHDKKKIKYFKIKDIT